jgi:hypothetical protein
MKKGSPSHGQNGELVRWPLTFCSDYLRDKAHSYWLRQHVRIVERGAGQDPLTPPRPPMIINLYNLNLIFLYLKYQVVQFGTYMMFDIHVWCLIFSYLKYQVVQFGTYMTFDILVLEISSCAIWHMYDVWMGIIFMLNKEIGRVIVPEILLYSW